MKPTTIIRGNKRSNLKVAKPKMKIDVTEQDIIDGKMYQKQNYVSIYSCPVALAVKRTAKTNECSVSDSTCRIISTRYPLPRTAQRFIAHFDAHKKVKPFSFEIQL